MAINFPTNPTNGQTFVALGRGWQYNSTSGKFEFTNELDGGTV